MSNLRFAASASAGPRIFSCPTTDPLKASPNVLGLLPKPWPIPLQKALFLSSGLTLTSIAESCSDKFYILGIL